MTITQMQRKLARVMRDLDAIGSCLYWRRFPYECDHLENAVTDLTYICDGFLDADELERLDSEDALAHIVGRPEPFTIGVPSAHEIDEAVRKTDERVRKRSLKTKVVKRTVKTASGKMTLLKVVPRKPAKKQARAKVAQN